MRCSCPLFISPFGIVQHSSKDVVFVRHQARVIEARNLGSLQAPDSAHDYIIIYMQTLCAQVQPGTLSLHNHTCPSLSRPAVHITTYPTSILFRLFNLEACPRCMYVDLNIFLARRGYCNFVRGQAHQSSAISMSCQPIDWIEFNLRAFLPSCNIIWVDGYSRLPKVGPKNGICRTLAVQCRRSIRSRFCLRNRCSISVEPRKNFGEALRGYETLRHC